MKSFLFKQFCYNYQLNFVLWFQYSASVANYQLCGGLWGMSYHQTLLIPMKGNVLISWRKLSPLGCDSRPKDFGFKFCRCKSIIPIFWSAWNVYLSHAILTEKCPNFLRKLFWLFWLLLTSKRFGIQILSLQLQKPFHKYHSTSISN